MGSQVIEEEKETKELAKTKFYSPDCQIDTDLELLLPVSYVENTAERIRLYRELDNIKEEEVLQRFEADLVDRFGKIPPQTNELLIAVRLRWLAMELGLSKILLKHNKMFCYFMTDDSAMYFNSSVFSRILSFVNQNPTICRMKEQTDIQPKICRFYYPGLITVRAPRIINNGKSFILDDLLNILFC